MFMLHRWHFDADFPGARGAAPEVAVVARELARRVRSKVRFNEESIDLLDCGASVYDCERHPDAFSCCTFRDPYLLLHLYEALKTLGGTPAGGTVEKRLPDELNKPWEQLSWFTKARLRGPSLFWPTSWKS